jgi:hypothetical protein
VAVDNMEEIRKILLNDKELSKNDLPAALEIFKLYYESIETNREKREKANSFYLSISTGIIAAVGFLFQKDCASELKLFSLFLPVAGIITGFFWYKLVHSYRQLNQEKFNILDMIEENLPLAPFTAEWKSLGSGKDKRKYHQITSLEKWIPCLFIVLHCLLLFYFIYLQFCGNGIFQKCVNP